jgi:hypothetical protein
VIEMIAIDSIGRVRENLIEESELSGGERNFNN